MKKSPKGPKVDPYLEGLMAKLLERLVSLEKKMDTVISQTGGSRATTQTQVPVVKEQPRRERMLYEAVCADCHKVCEVPFKPSEDRAVYCKACFARRKSGGHGMPVLTPVTLPPKPVGKLHVAVPSSAPASTKKAKKSVPVKRSKKKKK